MIVFVNGKTNAKSRVRTVLSVDNVNICIYFNNNKQSVSI